MADAFTTNLPDNVRELRPGKQLNSYRIAIRDPLADMPGMVDVVAATPAGAISYARGTCFSRYRDLRVMSDWTYEIVAWVPGSDVALLPEWVPNA